MKNCIGIDPGRSKTNPGGIAKISEDGSVQVYSLPVDDKSLLDVLLLLIDSESRIAIERQWARPGNGKFSTWSMAESYGAIKMAITSTGVPYITVPPATWQKQMIPMEGGTKKRSIQTARTNYPKQCADFKMKDSGKADALNIAHWLMSIGEEDVDEL